MTAPLWPRLVESLERAPVIRVEDYDYFVHPLTDGVAPLTAELLTEATGGLAGLLPERFDTFLTPEAMGIPVTTALTIATGKPFLVARKRPYGLPGEVVVPYRTGYSAGALHVNGLGRGEAVVVVDDVLSRAGTVRALSEACRRAGARLAKVVVLFNKGNDLAALSAELGAPVESLLDVHVERGRVRVVPPRLQVRP